MPRRDATAVQRNRRTAMLYWDDFRDKYGFDEGASVPPDAEAVRAVYVEILNAGATRLGADCRAVAFDRPGLHNPCMVAFRKVDPAAADQGRPDDAMGAAIGEMAEMLDADGALLDGLVATTVKVRRRALAALCARLRKGRVNTDA